MMVDNGNVYMCTNRVALQLAMLLKRVIPDLYFENMFLIGKHIPQQYNFHGLLLQYISVYYKPVMYANVNCCKTVMLYVNNLSTYAYMCLFIVVNYERS